MTGAGESQDFTSKSLMRRFSAVPMLGTAKFLAKFLLQRRQAWMKEVSPALTAPGRSQHCCVPGRALVQCIQSGRGCAWPCHRHPRSRAGRWRLWLHSCLACARKSPSDSFKYSPSKHGRARCAWQWGRGWTSGVTASRGMGRGTCWGLQALLSFHPNSSGSWISRRSCS